MRSGEYASGGFGEGDGFLGATVPTVPVTASGGGSRYGRLLGVCWRLFRESRLLLRGISPELDRLILGGW